MSILGPILGSLGGTLLGSILNRDVKDRQKSALQEQEKLARAEREQKELQTRLRKELEQRIKEAEKNPLPLITFAGLQQDPGAIFSQIQNMTGFNKLQDLAGLGAGGAATSQLAALTTGEAGRADQATAGLVDDIVTSLLLRQLMGGQDFTSQLQSSTGLSPMDLFSAFANN